MAIGTEDFRREMWNSHPGVLRMVKYFRDRGHWAEDKTEMETLEDRIHVLAYPEDKGDIWVILKGTTELLRAEVKLRGYDFTCAADFPFRTIAIGEVGKVERAEAAGKVPLLGYFIVNKAMTVFLFIAPSTRDQWRQEMLIDRKYGDRRCLSYCVPRELAIAFRLDEAPEQPQPVIVIATGLPLFDWQPGG